MPLTVSARSPRYAFSVTVIAVKPTLRCGEVGYESASIRCGRTCTFAIKVMYHALALLLIYVIAVTEDAYGYA